MARTSVSRQGPHQTKQDYRPAFYGAQPLVAVANGLLKSVSKTRTGRKPLLAYLAANHNYSITLNVALTKLLKTSTPASGGVVPVHFWILLKIMKRASKGEANKTYLRFLEEYLGPYPFARKRSHRPYESSGHGTSAIIAYGSTFTLNEMVSTGSCCTN